MDRMTAAQIYIVRCIIFYTGKVYKTNSVSKKNTSWCISYQHNVYPRAVHCQHHWYSLCYPASTTTTTGYNDHLCTRRTTRDWANCVTECACTIGWKIIFWTWYLNNIKMGGCWLFGTEWSLKIIAMPISSIQNVCHSGGNAQTLASLQPHTLSFD